MPALPLLLASATEQARQVSSGRVDAASLLRQQLAAIASANPQLNAFVEVIVPEPAAASSTPSSPLAGACFAVKDNIDVRGVASHAGLHALHAQPALRDASVVARLKAAGLQCVGKLNMHAVALGATNHNADFGNCYNPRRLTHTPGGSSGGAGAAVAAGLCAIALGTDTMGSVRIPASYCGVVGFKPSFEAIATDGVMPLCRLLDHVGILARSVEDVVHAFRAIGDGAGKAMRDDDGDGSDVPLRFAIPSSLDALGLEAGVREAFAAALEPLRDAGFTLHPLDLGEYPFGRARRAGLLLCEAELLNTLAVPLAQRRDEIPRHLLALLEYAEGAGAASLAGALTVVVEAGRWVHRALLPFDALLMPTAAQTAFAMDAPVPPNQADFTAMANMSGGPAISLPMPVQADALPAGLQLTARRGEDRLLLSAALRVQAALR
jgi:Asp-tRNA(Asn)/Glu-tRNA(Gln) amidotransferase A subunit family amidase